MNIRYFIAYLWGNLFAFPQYRALQKDLICGHVVYLPGDGNSDLFPCLTLTKALIPPKLNWVPKWLGFPILFSNAKLPILNSWIIKLFLIMYSQIFYQRRCHDSFLKTPKQSFCSPRSNNIILEKKKKKKKESTHTNRNLTKATGNELKWEFDKIMMMHA